MQLTDRVALVTVAGPGIGPASACPLETSIHQETERRDVEEVRTSVESLEGEMPPAGVPESSEPVALLVLFLASDASDHITKMEIRIDDAESQPRGRARPLFPNHLERHQETRP